MLEQLDELIKADEVNIKRKSKWDNAAKVLSSIPGFGLIITQIIAMETDGISRFSSPEAYTCYSGLAPATHNSGGKMYNGKMMW
jgi:transposase